VTVQVKIHRFDAAITTSRSFSRCCRRDAWKGLAKYAIAAGDRLGRSHRRGDGMPASRTPHAPLLVSLASEAHVSASYSASYSLGYFVAVTRENGLKGHSWVLLCSDLPD